MDLGSGSLMTDEQAYVGMEAKGKSIKTDKVKGLLKDPF